MHHDYPSVWKTAFSFLLERVKGEQAFVELMVAVLAILDDEIVRLRPDKRDEQITKIKDTMRDEVIDQLASFLTGLLDGLVHSDNKQSSLLRDTLKAIEGLVDWNSVELFSGVLPSLTSLVGSQLVRCSALRCLHSLIKKGMDYSLKFELLSSLNIMQILKKLMEDALPELDDSEFPSIVAQLISSIGIIAVDALSLQKCSQLETNLDFLSVL